MAAKAPRKEQKPRVTVRKIGSKAYISTEDFFNNPAYVRDTVLPKYGTLYVTRHGHDVVLEVRVPKLEDIGVEIEEF